MTLTTITAKRWRPSRRALRSTLWCRRAPLSSTKDSILYMGPAFSRESLKFVGRLLFSYDHACLTCMRWALQKLVGADSMPDTHRWACRVCECCTNQPHRNSQEKPGELRVLRCGYALFVWASRRWDNHPLGLHRRAGQGQESFLIYDNALNNRADATCNQPAQLGWLARLSGLQQVTSCT